MERPQSGQLTLLSSRATVSSPAVRRARHVGAQRVGLCRASPTSSERDLLTQPERNPREIKSGFKGEEVDLTVIIIMRRITGRHLLCLFLLAFPLSWAEDTKKYVRKSDNDTAGSQGRNRRLFARRKISPPQEKNTPKNKSNPPTPARRCGRLMESCSTHVPCCDPCASCRCRLFNTICHCWRMNALCLKKT